jgi:hypothetical protein
MVLATAARILMTEGTGLAATAGAGAPFAELPTAGAGGLFAVPATAGAGAAFALAVAAVPVAAVAAVAGGVALAALGVAAVPLAAVAVGAGVAAAAVTLVGAAVAFVAAVPYGVYKTVTGYHIVINSTDAVLDLAIEEVLQWQCSTTHEDNNTEAVSKEKKLQWLGKYENLTQS